MLSVRRATFLYCALPGHYIISIHALREEGDDTSTNPLAGSF